MIVQVEPGMIGGEIQIPPGKSLTQRAFILALLNKGKTILRNAGTSADEAAALEVIRSCGALINTNGNVTEITVQEIDFPSLINCGESGLLLRTFSFIASLADKKITLTGSGSLFSRKHAFLHKVFPQLGVEIISDSGKIPLEVQGPLKPRNIEVAADESSQFISGLLIALSYATEQKITVTLKHAVSKPYIDLTVQMMKRFGYDVSKSGDQYFISPHQKHTNVVEINIEADWSNAAFWFVASAIAGELTLKGLNADSLQGDKRLLNVLAVCGIVPEVDGDRIKIHKPHFLYSFHFDATDTPDLFPPLVALACYCNGISTIKGVHRLTGKESNRAESLLKVFSLLGADIRITGDEMMIQGGTLKGGVVGSFNDHRIVMAAAVAGLRAENGVVIHGADAVNKSYPLFFEHLRSVNGKVTFDKEVARSENW